MSNIKTLIEVDVKYNLTPDIAELRYYGKGIPVFLWDDLQDYTTLQHVLGSLDLSRSYEVKHFGAMTTRKYVPWYNMEDGKNTFAAYCLEEYDDLALMEVPEYTYGTPLPMKGKVINVSLEALQELDNFYENEQSFVRQKIKVQASVYTKHIVEAFTWFNDVDDISVFDNGTSEYVLDKGIDLTPFNTKKFNSGVEYYDMG